MTKLFDHDQIAAMGKVIDEFVLVERERCAQVALMAGEAIGRIDIGQVIADEIRRGR